jgi:dUTPase
MNEQKKVINYYVDREKADQKSKELKIEITPKQPVIKNVGLFSDAGADIFAAYEFIVPPHDYLVVDSFVGFIMPSGVAALVWPRGGDSFLVGSGVIDTGYTGTIKVKIVNPYKKALVFSAGDSIGQVVFFLKGIHSSPELQEISKVSIESFSAFAYERGEDGRINYDKSLL